MVDDLGPGWVDFDGSSASINTPNLERLADSGMVFTQAYAAASQFVRQHGLLVSLVCLQRRLD